MLGHPARVRILELLRDGERSVGALQAELGLESGGDLAAPGGAAADRARRIAARGDERLLPGRRRAASSTCSRRVARIVARQLAEQQSILQRARDDVSGAAARAGRGAAVGARWRSCGSCVARSRRPHACRPSAAPCLARRRVLGARRGEPLAPASRARSTRASASTALTGFFLGTLGVVARAGARLLVAATSSRPARGRTVGAPDGGVPARAALVLVRARPAHVPRRLGGDDAAAGGGDPRRARGRRARAAQRLLLRRGHPPRRRRDVDRDPAARARGRDRRRRRRSRPAPGCRSRSRSPRSSGWGRRPA